MTTQSFGLTDIGVSRSNNEDVWIALPDIGFYALADGMGGHQAGEIAAQEAINYLSNSFIKSKIKDPDACKNLLQSAIEKTSLWVHRLSKKNPAYAGMGTTLCCLIQCNNTVIYAHVGDSRIYRLRNQKLELLTQDHSLLSKWLSMSKESQTPFPYKNVITKAIGTSVPAHPEIASEILLPGDLFLLCSDGLSDVLSSNEIENILNTTQRKEEAARELIQQAKNKGSSDNITLVIIQTTFNEENLSRQQRDHSSRSESSAGNAAGTERTSGQSG